MYSVVETVNGIGLSCDGSGTLKKKHGTGNLESITSQWPLSMRLLHICLGHFSFNVTDRRKTRRAEALHDLRGKKKHSDGQGLNISVVENEERHKMLKKNHMP